MNIPHLFAEDATAVLEFGHFFARIFEQTNLAQDFRIFRLVDDGSRQATVDRKDGHLTGRARRQARRVDRQDGGAARAHHRGVGSQAVERSNPLKMRTPS